MLTVDSLKVGAMGNPWDGVIPPDEQADYQAAGLGKSSGIGSGPGLLIIDVQYRTIGTQPKPFREAIKEFPTSCGEVGWAAVPNIRRILAEFRDRKWPVLYPHVSPKQTFDKGRLSEKMPAIMTVQQRGYDFVDEVAPTTDDAGVDTLVVTGCTTSGCIRSSVVDAFAYNFRVMVPPTPSMTAAPPHTPSICSIWRRNMRTS
jgi:maleamate amidohydrolase